MVGVKYRTILFWSSSNVVFPVKTIKMPFYEYTSHYHNHLVNMVTVRFANVTWWTGAP